MSRKSLLLLCSSLCFISATLANTPVRPTSISKRTKSTAKTERVIIRKDSTRSNGSLIADRLEFHNKVSSPKDLQNKALAEELALEELEYPAIDLYGENSWNRYVNPFSGTGASIPDRFAIDCSNYVSPIESRRITSHYGYRRSFGRMHYGIDIGLSRGDTIRAAFDGKVRVRDYERAGYGYYVVIRHPNGLETVYGHMSKQLVKENQIVRAGEPIGLGGSTGRSTGPHLHFEARFMGIPLNPIQLFDFEEGVPLRDEFVFIKGNSKQYAASGARASKRASSARAAKRSGKSSKPATYRVRKGDTLSTIAKRNGTTVSKICAANGISKSKKLVPGKALRLN